MSKPNFSERKRARNHHSRIFHNTTIATMPPRHRLPPYESGKMIGQCKEECELRKDTQDVCVHDFWN